MPFDFDTIIDRRNTGCVKHDKVEENGFPADTLPMFVADMDFQVAPCIIEALNKKTAHGIFGYSFATEGYFSALQNWFAKRFGWEIQKDWIRFSPGVVSALSTAVRILTQPGDAVMVLTPVYPPFFRAVQNNDRKLVECPLLYENGRYSIDFADFEEKIVSNAVKMLILCSPHNPICRVWTQEELSKLGTICLRHGVKVVSDEIHCDFTWPGVVHNPFPKACPEMIDNVIVCTAPSKTFNLAGLQTSNIIIPGAAIREAWNREMDRLSIHEPNSLGLIACQAAYENGAPWLDACIAYMYDNLRYVQDYLAENIPQIKVVHPEGTYFAWLDCSELGMTEEELNDLFLWKAHVWLDEGKIFGKIGGQFQRVVLASSRKVVAEALDRIRNALAQR